MILIKKFSEQLVLGTSGLYVLWIWEDSDAKPAQEILHWFGSEKIRNWRTVCTANVENEWGADFSAMSEEEFSVNLPPFLCLCFASKYSFRPHWMPGPALSCLLMRLPVWLGEDRQTEDMCVKYKVCLYRCACKEQSMLGSSKDKGETHIERGLGISRYGCNFRCRGQARACWEGAYFFCTDLEIERLSHGNICENILERGTAYVDNICSGWNMTDMPESSWEVIMAVLASISKRKHLVNSKR